MDRFRLLLAAGVVTALGTAFVIACEPVPTTTSPINTSPDNKNKPKKGDDDDTSKGDDDDTVVEEKKPESDPPLPDGGKPPGRVYAHSASALYLWDPLAHTLSKISEFKGFQVFKNADDLVEREAMLDIALDRDSVMYGTTDHGFVKVDPTTAQITYVKTNTVPYRFPNALSFVPIGTVDPTKEALVGYVAKDSESSKATTYVRVDLASGALVTLGELNSPGAAQTWRSSGDLIALIRNGNKAYLTVREIDSDGGDDLSDTENDSLAEIDPKTGKIINIKGSIGQRNFYGLGQWAGTAYGFNGDGDVVSINLETGAGTPITNLKEDGGAVAWFGAGVTTDSPTAP